MARLMNPDTIPKIIKEFSKTKKKFPDGRIDYSKEKECAVITIFVMYEGKLLLMKRSDKVGTYKGKWMALAGYYDEPVPLRKKIEEELSEEISVKEYDSLKVFDSMIVEDQDIGKRWIIFDTLIELKEKPEIRLDWEHTMYVWVDPREIENYDVVPGLIDSFRKVFK